MQHAPTTPRSALPVVPPAGVTAGVDWAQDDHAVAVVNATGTAIERFEVNATAAGLGELIRRLRRAGVGEVAIERPDGQIVGALLEAGLTVVVISPNQVKNLRGRYGQAGNKDDRFGAFVLADTLRTDRARLRPLSRTPRPPSCCGRPVGPAKISSGIGWRWPTNCARTCRPSSPARSGSSVRSTASPA